MDLIQEFRLKIQGMSFQPISDIDVLTIKEKQRKAMINARLEGLYFTEEERAFFDMLLEERVPLNIRGKLVVEWAMLRV